MSSHTHNCLEPFFWDYPDETIPEKNICPQGTLVHAIFWVFWCKVEITDRRTINLAQCHPIRTIGAPTSIIITIFMLDTLPATTLPIYPGMGQTSYPMAWFVANNTVNRSLVQLHNKCPTSISGSIQSPTCARVMRVFSLQPHSISTVWSVLTSRPM